jgi:hypothetical protein
LRKYAVQKIANVNPLEKKCMLDVLQILCCHVFGKDKQSYLYSMEKSLIGDKSW